jgi:hypothetical protein
MYSFTDSISYRLLTWQHPGKQCLVGTASVYLGERPGKFRVLDIEELDINKIRDIFQLNKAGKLQYNL